jgi:acyl-CoA reductase-like NAD-dependent aldehyde dehydrogenase
MKTLKHYIGGDWKSGSNHTPAVNPITCQTNVMVPLGSTAEIDAAVISAKRALATWSAMETAERCNFLSGIPKRLRGEGDFAEWPERARTAIISDIGKALAETEIEVIETADMIQFYLDNAPSRLADIVLPINKELWPTKHSVAKARPVGVVGVIKPWNYPLEVPFWSIAAALVAGNTVVFKPSESSPQVSDLIAQLFDACEFPPGVFNVVYGGADTGSQLVAHHDVNMISFTGSHAVGVEIAKLCASQVKKLTLELSGNDAAIVCADADIELATNGVLWGSLCNAGQVCTGVKRVIVIGQKQSQELVERLVARCKDLRAGVDLGPIVSVKQLVKLETQIAEAVKEGATLKFGGKRTGAGLYFQPTVLCDVKPGSVIFREELFGPVIAVATAHDEAHAIELANQTSEGLGASVWTSDRKRAEHLMDLLQVGMVWHNDVNVAFPEAPWGGVKQSGIGLDLSLWSIDEYVVRKHYSFEESTDTSRFWWFPYKG